MKRYLVFAYHDYYPCGGVNDIVLHTDDRDAVVEWYKLHHTTYDRIDVLDLTVEVIDAKADIWQEIHKEAAACA